MSLAPDLVDPVPGPPPTSPPRALVSPERLSRRQRRRESALLGALFLGLALALAGGAVASVDVAGAYLAGMLLSVAGSLGVLAAVGLSGSVPTLRHFARGSSGGTRYDQLRYGTRLTTVSVFLNLLTVAAVAFLAASLAYRIQPIPALAAPVPIVVRLALVFEVILVANLGAALLVSLRAPRERAGGPLGGLAALLFGGVAAAFTLLGGLLAVRPLVLAGAPLRTTDAPFLLLAGAAAAAVSLALLRGLPTLYSLATGQGPGTRGYLGRRKSVMLPVALAFALLFLVVLVLLVFGVGVVGLIAELPRNTLVLGGLGSVVAAMVASVVLSALLSRSADEAALFRARRTPESRRGLLVLGISAALAILCFGASAWLATDHAVGGLAPARWLDFLAFGLLAILGPYGFLVAARYRHIRRLEERFPDFLRDLAASRKAGLTLPASVAIAARGEYGALTPEIVKMADQLSWNVPFDEALQDFARRVRTPLAQRTVSLVVEAGRTGGNVTDVLLAAARDAREIKNLEIERRQTIGLYTAIVYITFGVFLTVAAVLYGTFVPVLTHTAASAGGAATGAVKGFEFAGVSNDDYRTFYFLAALVQGVGNGFVAGVMTSGRLLEGLRHSFIMVAITYLVFAVVLPGV